MQFIFTRFGVKRLGQLAVGWAKQWQSRLIGWKNKFRSCWILFAVRSQVRRLVTRSFDRFFLCFPLPWIFMIGVRRLFLNAFLGERTSRSTRNSRLAGRILNGRLLFVSIEWKRSMERNESWEWAWRRLLKYEKKRKVYYAYAINANSRRASDEDKSERKSCDRSYRTRSK